MCITRINRGLMMTALFCIQHQAGAHLRWTRDHSRVIYGISLSITTAGSMLHMPRLCVSLVSESGMFWWTPSVPISDGPPWSQLFSAQVLIRHFLLLLLRVVVWSVDRSGRQICCSPFWRKAVEGSSRSAIYTCHPSPSLTTFAFMSWEMMRLLLDLDSWI